jgi:hypothetical protein
MELDDRAGAAIGRRKGFIPAGTYVAVQARLAVAQDRAGGIAGTGVDRVIEPLSIACRDEHFGVETAEGLGVSVVDVRCHA